MPVLNLIDDPSSMWCGATNCVASEFLMVTVLAKAEEVHRRIYSIMHVHTTLYNGCTSKHAIQMRWHMRLDVWEIKFCRFCYIYCILNVFLLLLWMYHMSQIGQYHTPTQRSVYLVLQPNFCNFNLRPTTKCWHCLLVLITVTLKDQGHTVSSHAIEWCVNLLPTQYSLMCTACMYSGTFLHPRDIQLM